MAVTVHEYIPNVHEKPRVDIKSDKFNHTFTIRPTQDGFIFYEISVDKGNLPEKLKGRYSRMSAAVEAVKEYERLAPVSKTVKRDLNTQAREAQKQAEV